MTASRNAPHSPDVADGDAVRGVSTEVRLDPERPLAAGAAALQPGRFLALYELGRLLMQQREPAQVLRTVHEQILLHLAPDESCLLAAEGGALRPLAEVRATARCSSASAVNDQVFTVRTSRCGGPADRAVRRR